MGTGEGIRRSGKRSVAWDASDESDMEAIIVRA
jgi:hypothetical protein